MKIPHDIVSNIKTTIDIAQTVLDDARRLAAQEGTTLRALVEEGLRAVIDDRSRPDRDRYRFRPVVYGGSGTQPGIDLRDWRGVRDLAYEGHGT